MLALASIPLWLVFEFYNLYIDNWYYVGLPGNFALRMFGYAWSFATIWPAIFEASDLIGVWRGSVHGGSEHDDQIGGLPTAISIVAGALMLIVPLVVSSATARYLAAPVWLGFIFLLDPINALLGGPSLMVDLVNKRYARTVDLLLSGLLCGVLWEFWNYWALAKWHYTVPIMEHVKLFEMPLPGFLGFPAFALECFVMWVFLRRSCKLIVTAL
jgi:hypothetical protein